MDQFRGIFRLTYAGDAHIVLRTKVQVRTLPIPLLARTYIAPRSGQSAEPQTTGYTPHDRV